MITDFFSSVVESVKGPIPTEGREPGDIAVTADDTDPDAYDGEFDDVLDGVTSVDADTDTFALDAISYMAAGHRGAYRASDHGTPGCGDHRHHRRAG